MAEREGGDTRLKVMQVKVISEATAEALEAALQEWLREQSTATHVETHFSVADEYAVLVYYVE